LEKLNLSSDGLVGTIPNFQLSNLNKLDLNNNELSGTIPTLENTNLVEFYAINNKLSGTIPNVKLPNLIVFYFKNNQLDSCAITTINCPKLNGFDISNNKLTFNDILRSNMNVYDIKDATSGAITQGYTSQDSCGILLSLNYKEGEIVKIDCGVDYGVASNQYKWYKDKNTTAIPIQTQRKLSFNTIKSTDAGDYYCEISNTNAPSLILHRRAIHIQVSSCPTVTLGATKTVTSCANNKIDAMITLSTNNNNYTISNYTWTSTVISIPSKGTGNIINNITAGIYLITATLNNGCNTTTTVEINDTLPKATITTDRSVICPSQDATLKVINQQGMTLQWLLNDKPIPLYTNSQIKVKENETGMYKVEATLLQNTNCKVFSNSLTINTGSLQHQLLEQTICDGESFLNHSAAGKYIDTLKGKYNRCDTIRTLILQVVSTPKAVTDFAVLGYNILELSDNISTNDLIQENLPYIYTVSKPPKLGILTAFDTKIGIFTYKRELGVNGLDSMVYTVCSEGCPSLCSNATVYFRLRPEKAAYGLDEMLVGEEDTSPFIIPRFDQQPCDCPNKEVVIVNRWGEVVFHAVGDEWNNSDGWNGRYMGTGGYLPSGTYYKYIKVNIGQGETYVGTITLFSKS
jgi:hypothetical protein